MKVEAGSQKQTPSQTSHQKSSAGSPLAVIFFTIFIDLIGFGIIIPLSPYLAREFHATPFEVGLLLSAYSLMQFIFSPFWGGLSDRLGRRPVILISLLGGAASYTLFAFGHSYWILLLARSLAGVFGGNISAAHAYIADVTSAENRSKGMALIGAAFGLGFIFGPLIGAVLGHVGESLGSAPPLGLSFSALGAAILCLANFTFAFFVLRESLAPENRGASERRSRIAEIRRHMRRPIAGPLMWVFFLSGLAMAQMEAMLFPYMSDVFGWDLRQSSYGFAYIGVLMVFTQGFLVRKWMPRFGEGRVLTIGLAMFALSLIAIPISMSIALLAVVMTVLAIGNGLMRPPNLGLISLATPAQEQGMAMGVTNSLASLGRIVGPILGGWFYTYAHGAPFVLAGGLAAVGCTLAVVETRRLRAAGLTESRDKTQSDRQDDRHVDPRESQIVKIGSYQLENLLKNQVPFLFLYVGAIQPAGHAAKWMTAAQMVEPQDVIEFLKRHARSADHPIVLLCEDGKLSDRAAQAAEQAGFINIFVVFGGLTSLV